MTTPKRGWPWYLAAAVVWLAALAFLVWVLSSGRTGERPSAAPVESRP